ncbi:MAG TPA: homoserine kinase [Polyangiaceae bacterium]|nr:homoserine kinase [Polyangiaceae bacterium]
MALLTLLAQQAAEPILERYGLLLAEIEPLRAGSVNSNFRIRDASGSTFFLRIYEEQDAAGAAREVELLRRLHAAGVPSALPRQRTDGAWLAEHASKPVACFEWVEGSIVCQKQVTAAHCARLGAALAQVHLTGASSLSEGRFRITDLEGRLDGVERSGVPELVNAARAIRSGLREYAARRDASLPRGLIHGDLFRDNVLWRGEELRALLDFESASEGPFVYDVMVTLLAWCYGSEFDTALAHSLLAAYHRTRPLGSAEFRALAIEGGIAALRFATTRMTDFSLRAPQGQPPLRDYRRFLERRSALERGALSSVIAAVRAGNGA